MSPLDMSSGVSSAVRNAGSASWLRRMVGRALGRRVEAPFPDGGLRAARARRARGMASGFEALEGRQLFEGSFANAIAITLTNGQASEAGAINPATPTTDNDYYSFVMPGAAGVPNFVSILADTRNEGVSGSPLDTRVSIFAESDLVNPIVGGVASGNANDVSGINNGTLTSGAARDGWGGFIGIGGTRYFVIVSSDNTLGSPVAGSYTLRVSAGATETDVDLPTGIVYEDGAPVPNFEDQPPQLPTAIVGQIQRLQQDMVFQYVAPNDPAFNSLVTLNAQVTQANPALRLDSRVEVYRQTTSTGRVQRIAFDSDAGRLNDAATAFRANAGETYWVRVRSDEIRPNVPTTPTGTGSFFVVMDGRAEEFTNPMDVIDRRASTPLGAFIGFDPPTVPPTPNVPAPVFQSANVRFVSQGSGTTIIVGVPAGLVPVNDPALSLYNSSGQLLAFNDNFSGLSAQIAATIQGGQEYFIVLDGFTVNNGVQFGLFVESNHTFDITQPVDDHPNTPQAGQGETTRLGFEQATPIRWGDEFLTFDDDGNLVRDVGYRQEGQAEGRIHQSPGQPPDTDLFQFTLPADMLGSFDGDNDDLGSSLYAGGRFDVANPNTHYPTISGSLSSMDANDWWYTGPQQDLGDGRHFGMNVNTAASGRAEVYAMQVWDPSPTSNIGLDGLPTTNTDLVLVVGGDFNLVIPGAQGPVEMRNIAAWAWSSQLNKFLWFDTSQFFGDANAPVRALTVFDPEGYDPDGTDDPDSGLQTPPPNGPATLPALADPGGPWLVAGGDFQNIGGTAVSRVAFFDGAWNDAGGGVSGGANVSVRSLIVFDPEDPGDERQHADPQAGPPPVPELQKVPDAPDPPRMLFVGGVFTSAGAGGALASQNLAAWTGQTTPIPAANQRGVRLHSWNTPVFGSSPETTRGNSLTASKPTWTINGAVNAMTIFEMPDIDGNGPYEAGERLVVGGEFTQIGGTASSELWNVVFQNGAFNRVAMLGRVATWVDLNNNGVGDGPDIDEANDPEIQAHRTWLAWDPLNNGVTGGAVFALTSWDPPDVGGTIPPVLAVGGAFTAADGNPAPQLAVFQPFEAGAAAWAGLAAPDGFTNEDGSPGVVRTLTAFNDEQESAIARIDGDSQEALYIGGQFTDINGTAANNVGAFFFDPAVPGFVFGALGQGQGGGVSRAPADAVPAAEVFVLQFYDDGDPTRWDHHARPSSRVAITVNPTFAGFENTFIRVYDSAGTLIYENDTINPFGPDPSGSFDPRLSGPPAANDQLVLDGMWAGETYYLEVSDAGGNGTGRYIVDVIVDAIAPDVDDPGDTLPDELNGVRGVEIREGRFQQSVRLLPQLGSGDTNLNIGSSNQPPPFQGRSTRQFTLAPTPEGILAIAEVSDLGNISTIDDTDLWNFRAEASGYVEIRVQTRDYNDEFGEIIDDVDDPADLPFIGLQRVIRSALDSAIRVFDNDFTQLAYNDDNFALPAEAAAEGVGTLGNTVFYRRDGRVVFPVVAGNVYYIQVESGQRWEDGRPADIEDRVHTIDREVDWRRAIGGYQLLVNAMPQLPTDLENGNTVQDDHPTTIGGAPAPATNATPIPIGDDFGNSATLGRGSATGVINNTPNNPLDNDFFFFISPGSGEAVISITRTNGTTLSPSLTLFDANGNPLGDASPTGPGSAEIRRAVTTGERYAIRVIGAGLSEGSYRIDISGIAPVDDHADEGKAWRATDIDLLNFRGAGSATGEIEDIGDTDMFRVQIQDFSNFTVTVDTPGGSTFDPFVTVYEMMEDPTGKPVFYRIAVNDDISGANTDARASFSVAPNRRVDVDPPGEDREYPYYYILVRGSNPFADFGTYTVTINFPPTDDHADAALLADPNPNGLRNTSQYSFATVLALDPVNGAGTDDGVIERSGDTDLFTFVAPATGTTSVNVTRAEGSLLRTRLTILANTGSGQPSQTIITTTAPDDTGITVVRVSFDVSRGTRYFVVVEGFNEPNVNLAASGAYTLNVSAPPIDDFPNATEWDLAAPITLSGATGGAQVGGEGPGDPLNARLSPTGDSDLFSTIAIANGSLTFTVTPLAISGGIAPRLSIYDASRNLLQQVSATAAGQERFITLSNVTAGTFFFILVENLPGVSGAALTGDYRLRITGPAPGGGGGGGPDPSIIDFANPTVIDINPRNGLGQRNDVIDVSGDRDLFTFNTFGFTGPGDTIIQVVTPEGSLLDATVRILQNPNEGNDPGMPNNGFDADGIPGATAQYRFNAQANRQYWVIVDGVGQATGSYTVRVSTRPAGNALYFPEGFANAGIESFLAVSNPNTARDINGDGDITDAGEAAIDASYTIYLRYETASGETVLFTGSLAAGVSARHIVSSAAGLPSGVLANTPFSIVIQSDVALAASFSHTDKGGSLGEALTNVVAPTWNFARAEKNPGGADDFVLFYNPQNFAIIVTLTAYQADGSIVTDTRLVQGLKRHGWALNDMTTLANGAMSITVSARAADSAFNNQFEGIVASLSHYDLVNPAAFAVYGDQGATAQAIQSFSQGSLTDSQIILFNPGTSTATVNIVGSYVRVNLPGITRLLDIQPKQRIVLTGSQLGIATDQPIGLRVNSSQAISVVSTQRQRGEMDATNASSTAGTRFLLGSTRLDLGGLGNLFFSTLNFYNPAAFATTINIRLAFTDGTSEAFTLNIGARGFAEARLHERTDLFAGRTGTVEFAIDATGGSPFVLTNTYYDLAAGTGWTASAQPFGLTNTIARI